MLDAKIFEKTQTQVLKGLQPTLLWNIFANMTQIPRPSGAEQKIVSFLKNLGEISQASVAVDEIGNVLIKKPGQGAAQNRPAIILQGHVDMVCEKKQGIDFDFDQSGLVLRRVDDWIYASDTTLGADNGIGVAAALALLFEKDLSHPPLEILLTVDEERGLSGVWNVKPEWLSSKTLLNLDSEDEGIFSIGCAGGIDGVFQLAHAPISDFDTDTWSGLKIQIDHLRGGHSGLAIHLGRANAIKVCARLMGHLLDEKIDVLIHDWDGGNKRNAIPRYCHCSFQVPQDQLEKTLQVLNQYNAEIRQEFQSVEPEWHFEIQKLAPFPKALGPLQSQKLINLLNILPHGVMLMSQEIPGKVETSTNLGTIKFSDDKITVVELPRSFRASGISMMKQKLSAIAQIAEIEIAFSSGYPAWTPKRDSMLLQKMCKLHQEFYGHEPELDVTHAGLETGVFTAKFPDMSMISFGPQIEKAHTPEERVSIKSVEKFYEFLKKVIAEL